jgi:hypothetical protein
MSSTAEELPQELWILILKHVDFRQRLSACTPVCQKLARAAAAATQSVSVSCYCRPQPLDAFLAWARASSHGSLLTRLKFSFSDSPIRQLPCPQLLELQGISSSVQLCASSEGMGLLRSCTALTSLQLDSSTLLDGDVFFL